jgi:hypothetical protein
MEGELPQLDKEHLPRKLRQMVKKWSFPEETGEAKMSVLDTVPHSTGSQPVHDRRRGSKRNTHCSFPGDSPHRKFQRIHTNIGLGQA